MSRQSPIFASERTAAKMLEMPCADFKRLVEKGALPKPITIGGEYVRWSVRELEAIKSGEIMDGQFEW